MNLKFLFWFFFVCFKILQVFYLIFIVVVIVVVAAVAAVAAVRVCVDFESKKIIDWLIGIEFRFIIPLSLSFSLSIWSSSTLIFILIGWMNSINITEYMWKESLYQILEKMEKIFYSRTRFFCFVGFFFYLFVIFSFLSLLLIPIPLIWTRDLRFSAAAAAAAAAIVRKTEYHNNDDHIRIIINKIILY